MGLFVCGLLVSFLAAGEQKSFADATPQPGVAMVGLDALGMDEERVRRLETLFLKELELLTGKRVPDRRSVARQVVVFKSATEATSVWLQLAKRLASSSLLWEASAR